MAVSGTSLSITPSLDILLRGSESVPIGLFHRHIATAEQLCRLHYSMDSLKAVKAKLRALCDGGYVQFDALPTKFTRSPYYYTMGKLEIEYLQKAGMDISEGYRASKEVDKHALFAMHTLELNDIIISAALLKRRPYKATWHGGSFSLIPDTFMVFRTLMPDGRQRRIPIVIEHDRGSEEQYYFRRRIRAYLVMLSSEGYKELFGVGGITIAFTTSVGAERLRKMREWIRKESEETGEYQSLSNLFYFTNLTKPIDPVQVWVNTTWLPLYENAAVALLGVQ
jgi:hypothetical protein